MKIEEIIKGGILRNIPNGVIEDVFRVIKNNQSEVKHLGKLEGLSLDFYDLHSEIILALRSGKETIGFISLYHEHYDTKAYEVGITYLDPKYRNKGLGFKLYQYVLDTLRYPLTSGYTQSPQARSVWKKLMSQTNKYRILLLKKNNRTGNKDLIDISDRINKINPWSKVNKHSSIVIVPR